MNEQQTEIPVGTKVIVRARNAMHRNLLGEFFYVDEPGVVVAGRDHDGDYIVLQDPERWQSNGGGWFVPGFCLDVIEEQP